MNVKVNINKIHSDLDQLFDSVVIKEKSNTKTGNFFELSSIKNGLEVKMIIPFKSLESNNNIKWEYFDNPVVENSNMVERVSTLVGFSKDVLDIIEKKRFSEDYLNNNK